MGVVGAIVPWNWPFHNIINPISAAVMSGNAIVIKVGGCVLVTVSHCVTIRRVLLQLGER